MKIIQKICLNCKNPFNTSASEIKRGNGKFCSHSCVKKYPRPKQNNVICAYCYKPFYLNNSKQKRSKSGLFFCCRLHKDLAQRIGGIAQIQPSHYGTAQPDDVKHYRKKAFDYYGKQCQLCDYNTHPQILQIHHIDKNRKNDNITIRSY